MRSFVQALFVHSLALSMLLTASVTARAELRPIPDDLKPTVLGRIYIDSDHDVITPRVKTAIDRMVPELRERSERYLIRIEGAYHQSPHKKTNISRSFRIAREIEHYLREHHQLDHNLCIASANGDKAAAERTSVAIIAYPGEFTEQKISP